MGEDLGNILQKRMRELMLERGWDLDDVKDRSPLSDNTIENIYYAKSTDPRASTVIALSELFDVTVNCLLGKCPHTTQEKILLRQYRSCGSHGKSVIELIAKYEATAAKAEREAFGKHSIPCVIPQGNIRGGIVYDECETVEIMTSVQDAYVGIKMPTNELAPIYCKGDTLLLENRFPSHGEYAVFFKEKRVYIRQYLEEGKQYRLRSIHDENRDMILNRMDQIDYIGTCIGVVRE